MLRPREVHRTDRPRRRRAPAVSDFMTRLPTELDRCDTVARAKEVMTEQGIRHIPVMDGTKLYGIISERDVDIVLAAIAGLADPPPLDAVCPTDTYAVVPTTPITEVAQVMVSRRVGSAVVVDQGFVVGIFTVVDALRALGSAYG